MASVYVRLYAYLNDFVSIDRRARRFAHVLNAPSSVKDAVEALGVPHPEIDLIVVNGIPVGFTHPLRDGDTVAVYPTFHSIDLGDLPRVGTAVPAPRGFVVDDHLRKLASYLRLAGFDAIVTDDDVEMVARAVAESRIVLTRDRQLLKRNAVRCGYWIRNTDPQLQFAELVERLDLARYADPFTRCLSCNSILQPVAK
jgi:molybdopterin converting factor small subunit